jgi:hypothetical protein
MLCSLADTHQTFTETYASISAADRGNRLICNGASLPDYTVLQLTTQWLSSSSSIWSHWGPKWQCARWRTHGNSSPLWTAFCYGCLRTSTLFSVVSHFLLFTQQFVLWATHIINMKTFHIISPCFINLHTLSAHLGVRVHKLQTNKILILVTDRDKCFPSGSICLTPSRTEQEARLVSDDVWLLRR